MIEGVAVVEIGGPPLGGSGGRRRAGPRSRVARTTGHESIGSAPGPGPAVPSARLRRSRRRPGHCRPGSGSGRPADSVDFRGGSVCDRAAERFEGPTRSGSAPRGQRGQRGGGRRSGATGVVASSRSRMAGRRTGRQPGSYRDPRTPIPGVRQRRSARRWPCRSPGRPRVDAGLTADRRPAWVSRVRRMSRMVGSEMPDRCRRGLGEDLEHQIPAPGRSPTGSRLLRRGACHGSVDEGPIVRVGFRRASQTVPPGGGRTGDDLRLTTPAPRRIRKGNRAHPIPPSGRSGRAGPEARRGSPLDDRRRRGPPEGRRPTTRPRRAMEPVAARII
jgi:hypothetical protein